MAVRRSASNPDVGRAPIPSLGSQPASRSTTAFPRSPPPAGCGRPDATVDRTDIPHLSSSTTSSSIKPCPATSGRSVESASRPTSRTSRRRLRPNGRIGLRHVALAQSTARCDRSGSGSTTRPTIERSPMDRMPRRSVADEAPPVTAGSMVALLKVCEGPASRSGASWPSQSPCRRGFVVGRSTPDRPASRPSAGAGRRAGWRALVSPVARPFDGGLRRPSAAERRLRISQSLPAPWLSSGGDGRLLDAEQRPATPAHRRCGPAG